MEFNGRFLAIVSLMYGLVGCATAIPYSATERCAQDGMVLTGINHGTSNASAVVYNYRGGLTTASASGVSTNVQCAVPNSDEEKKQIIDTRKELAPKEDYNQSLEGKKWLTGIGYFVYLVPGVVAKVIYDGQYDRAVEKSNEIASASPPPALATSQSTGTLRYSNVGAAPEIKARHDEADKKMSEMCKGKYKVISEGVDQANRTTASSDYWYINFQCN